jgi:hypothetical protein
MANPSYLALTSMKGQVLYSNQLSSTSATTIYTAPASSTVEIKTAVIANTDSVARSITVSVCKTGDTDGVTHRVLSAFPIPAAGDATTGGAISLIDFIGGLMLGEGDFISVTAGTANVLNVILTGVVSA